MIFLQCWKIDYLQGESNFIDQSTLNPYAASYVPLCKREVTDEGKASKKLPSEAAGTDVHLTPDDDYKLKRHQGDAVDAEHSRETDSKFVDEELEMDLAYLQMVFPGVSEQSLADVYNVNRGDLDAALDMLSHLESVDNLLDALDIEQPQEPVFSGECSSVKPVNVTGESSSSSQPSDSTVAT